MRARTANRQRVRTLSKQESSEVLADYGPTTVHIIVGRAHDGERILHGVHRNEEIAEDAVEAVMAEKHISHSVEIVSRDVDGIIPIETFLDLLGDRIADHREQCRQVKERAKDPEDDMPSGVAQLEVKERSAKIEELEKLREMVAAEDSAQSSQEGGADE